MRGSALPFGLPVHLMMLLGKERLVTDDETFSCEPLSPSVTERTATVRLPSKGERVRLVT